MDKITLKIFDKKYLPTLIDWYSNPNNRKYMLTQTISEDDALRMIRDDEDRKCYSIMLNNLPIGYVILLDIKSHIGRIVIMIDEPFTKKGYGQQALFLLEKTAKKLGVKRLTLEVYPDNLPAVSLYKKIGYTVRDTTETMEKKI